MCQWKYLPCESIVITFRQTYSSIRSLTRLNISVTYVIFSTMSPTSCRNWSMVIGRPIMLVRHVCNVYMLFVTWLWKINYNRIWIYSSFIFQIKIYICVLLKICVTLRLLLINWNYYYTNDLSIKRKNLQYYYKNLQYIYSIIYLGDFNRRIFIILY